VSCWYPWQWGGFPGELLGYVTNCGQRYFTIFKSNGYVTSSKPQHGNKGVSPIVRVSVIVLTSALEV
jgi:hypothetical protein